MPPQIARLLTVLLWLVLLPAPARTEPSAASPPFAGTTLPVPPHQNDPWTAPADLPLALTSATATLFAESLADPRGCEYRQVSVGTGSAWSGDGGVVQAHGWVLPAVAGQNQSFAVCWNGLVYPVITVDGPADLAADVQALVKADTNSYTFRVGNEAPPEAMSLSETSLLPLKACLLLRVGRTDLARTVWDEWTGKTPPHVNDNDAALADPYLMLASDWAWALFDRVVTAHMRGDDQLSLLSARQLAIIQPQIEAEAARRGFPRPNYFGAARPAPLQPYLNFLDPLPAVLADEERRVAEPKRTPALTVGLDTFPSKAARVAALFRDLDLVSARQWGQPGGVSLGSDPIVVALIAQGDDAVPPLLDALVHDDRLTRSVHFGRDFFRARSVLSVSEAAYVALSGILETSFFGVASTGDDLTQHPAAERQQIADAIRAYWQKYRGLSLPERWYRTLADDGAGREQWLQAAGNIVQPDNVQSIPGSMVFSESVTTTLAPGRKPRLRGEALRARSGPSVTDLMAKRVVDIAPVGLPTSSDAFIQMRDATRLALMLSAWDAAAAVPVLRAQMVRSQALLKAWPDGGAGPFTDDYAAITEARLRGGDTTAQADFSAWLHVVPPSSLPQYDLPGFFAPLWRHPADPDANATADWLFGDPHSPWNPILQKRPNIDVMQVENLISSPLLGLPAFRGQALLALADTRRVGTVTLQPGRQAEVLLDRIVDYGANTPPPGVATPLRACDVYASNLAQVDGFADFDPAWPPARRDQALALDAFLLRRYGGRLAYAPVFASLYDDPFHPRAHLTFSALGRPATQADVSAGRAIFALPGKRRVWEMPAFPLKARWLTLRDDPYQQQQFDPATGQSKELTAYRQDGWVWQAEEQQQADGHWERFYGFVGPHEVVRVPASEVEFPVNTAADPSGYDWLPLPQGLDARLTGPALPAGTSVSVTGLSFSKTVGEAAAPRLGDPLPLTLALRNRSGLPRPLPAGLARMAALHLFYAAPNPADPQDGPYAAHDWQELTPKAGAHFPTMVSRRLLEPTQSAAALSFDLRDWFTLARPGYYRAEMAFAPAPGQPVQKLSTPPFGLLPSRGNK